MVRGSDELLSGQYCKPLSEAVLVAIPVVAPSVDEHQVRVGEGVEFRRIAVQQKRDLGVLVLAVQVEPVCLRPGQRGPADLGRE